ncbi:MAG: hypothetical protein NT094_01885 [Candidatus Staskawiczbacteria bacterium]|nr:hypothetical protein [Candidatus Staskawiczbacteria bacterium]
MNKIESNNFIKIFFGWIITFIFVSFTWIFFKSSTIGDALTFIKIIFNPLRATEPIQLYVVLAIFVGFLFFLLEKQIFNGLKFFQEKMPVFLSAIFIVFVIILIFKLSPDTIPPFIYFGF